jgi:hypothetical protein
VNVNERHNGARDVAPNSETSTTRTRVYIPCPSCRRPLEVPVEGELPETLDCPECGAVSRECSQREFVGTVLGGVRNTSV